MIGEYIKKVREAVFGKDVKESIASALEQVYSDSNTSAEMEVINARGEHNTLRDRLNAIDNSIAEDKATMNEIEKQLATLEASIDSYEKSKLVVKDITEELSNGNTVNTGSAKQLPIFDLIEDPDSLLAVIYYVKYSQYTVSPMISFPAFIRSGENKGYFATSIRLSYNANTSGTQLNLEETIDISRTMQLINNNGSYAMTLTSVTAFILTRW